MKSSHDFVFARWLKQPFNGQASSSFLILPALVFEPSPRLLPLHRLVSTVFLGAVRKAPTKEISHWSPTEQFICIEQQADCFDAVIGRHESRLAAAAQVHLW